MSVKQKQWAVAAAEHADHAVAAVLVGADEAGWHEQVGLQLVLEQGLGLTP